jgi:hypothetical protein
MKPTIEEQILEEIRKRALELDSKNKEKEELDSMRKANAEALDDMTSLKKEDIARISFQVRQEFQKKAELRNRLMGFLGIFALMIGGTVVYTYFAKQVEVAQKQAYLNSNQFVETFDNNDRNWLIFNELKYEKRVEKGNYTIETNDGLCYWEKTQLNLPAHYAVELTSVWQRGEDKSEYGIALAQGNGDMLGFCLFPDGETYHGHYRNGDWEKATAWSKKIANPEREENVQRVEVKNNSSFKYFVNNTLAWEDTFSRTVPTEVGVRSCGKQIVDFKHIKVIDLATNSVIFEDEFDDANTTDWVTEKVIKRTSKIEKGKYVIETNVDDYCYWSDQKHEIKQGDNVDIILKMNHLKGETNNFGLFVSQDDNNYYVFDYKDTGKAKRALYQIDKWTYTGVEKETNIVSDKEKPPVTLRVEIRNKNCKYFVNDILIEEFDLEPYLNLNYVGVRCCGSQEVAFDELRIIPK